jgi:SagB-type dehydrogenase family enzyme
VSNAEIEPLASLSADVKWPTGLAARMIANSTHPAGRPPAASILPAAPVLLGDVTQAVPLALPHDLSSVRRTLTEVITARRSGGIVGEIALAQGVFATLLAATAVPLPQSLQPNLAMSPIVCPVVFNVEGIQSAAYRYLHTEHILLPIRTIEREVVCAQVLSQREHGSGAAILFLVVPLARWLLEFGDRGYRGVALQIGWITDRLYLVAEMLGLTYTASGAFAPARADELLGLDGYHHTCFFSFVLGDLKHNG